MEGPGGAKALLGRLQEDRTSRQDAQNHVDSKNVNYQLFGFLMIFMIFHDFQDLVSLRTSSHVVDHLLSIECLGLDGGAVAAPPARLGRSRTLGVPRGLAGHPRTIRGSRRSSGAVKCSKSRPVQQNDKKPMKKTVQKKTKLYALSI